MLRDFLAPEPLGIWTALILAVAGETASGMQDWILPLGLMALVAIWVLACSGERTYWLYASLLGLTGLHVVFLGWTDKYHRHFPPSPIGWVVVGLGLVIGVWGEHAVCQDQARAARMNGATPTPPPRPRRPRRVSRSRRRR